MAKLQWESLSAERVAAIEGQVGQVVKAESVADGLMPGLAAVLHAEEGTYFLKAASVENPAYHLCKREMSASTALPVSAPAPRLLFASDAGGWVVMVFGYLDARDGDLSPGSPDLPGLLAALGKIGSASAWPTAPPVTENVAVLWDKATVLLRKSPDEYPWNMYRAATGGFDGNGMAGSGLVHYDLHPGNLKVTGDGRVLAVDWAFACSGAPWIDAALLIPRLIEAGHTPADAERLMAQLPAWGAAPPDAVTALGALWTMFREYKAIYGPPDGRAFRAQAAVAGRSWVSYRMN